MKRKINLFVCVILAALCFTGCSAKSENAEYDVAAMEQTAEVVLSSFAAMTEEDLKQYKDLTEFQLNYVMMNSGLRIDAEDFLTMIKSWEAGEKECGAYVSHGDYIVDVKNNGVVISTEAKFEKREAKLNFSFNEDSYLESMDVSASYGMNEILTKSGLNTVLGMGVVFGVLIFLAILIGLMKYIPNLLNHLQKKETEYKPVEAPTPQLKTVTADNSVVNDLELIAVITAAIAAQEGTSTDGFVVRSIRRRPSNKWR